MRILLVEDEEQIRKMVMLNLEMENHEVIATDNGRKALELINSQYFDLIILDVMLPEVDGFQICEQVRLRNNQVGIIIVSAKDTSSDRVTGLKLGADDYLTKPFHLSELLVRIQAVMRRKNLKGNNLVIYSEIIIDTFSKTVKVKDKKIEITKKEIDLLLYLIGNENRVLSKSAIAEHLSGDMAEMLDNHDFVYAHIKNLKNKLKDAGCPDYIKTVYGLGYKWQNE